MNGCSARGPFRWIILRGELLAASRLAIDEDGCLAAREAIDHAAHLLHRGRFAEQLVAVAGLRFLGNLQRLLDQRAQLLEGDGLGQVVESAGLQRRHRVLGAAEGGDHRHRHVECLLRDVLDDAQAFAVGQVPVGQAEVERSAVEQALGLADRFRANRVETHARQRQLEQFEEIRLVVDDQHSGLTAGSARHGVGSLRVVMGCG